MYDADESLDSRIKELREKGVVILDGRQTYLSPDVDLGRIYPGSVLYPGTRLCGKRTLVGAGAKIGTEGPAVINDSVIGPDAEVASGFLDGAVLLSKAKAGANSHYRPGTLLEEHASTAHCVGLKQSILMYGVTCGSLINLCDILVSGGHSRKEHTEIGSGFIHFNYTPWGSAGDKATPSLIGNVTEGVFLDQPRIFLGGMSGIVGPQTVGFGAMTVAGQVVRKQVGGRTMHSEPGVKMDIDLPPDGMSPSESHCRRVAKMNLEYLVQLFALREWYLDVRMARCLTQNGNAGQVQPLVLKAAVETIEDCIKERVKRYDSFAREHGLGILDKEKILKMLDVDCEPENHSAMNPKNPRVRELEDSGKSDPGCLNETEPEGTYSTKPAPVKDWKPEMEYDEWVWGLGADEKEQLHAWLSGYAGGIRQELRER